MVKVLLTAVTADEVSAVVADGQLCDQNQHLLPLVKDFLTEDKDMGKPLAGGIRLFLQLFGAVIKCGFQQLKGFRSIRSCLTAAMYCARCRSRAVVTALSPSSVMTCSTAISQAKSQ